MLTDAAHRLQAATSELRQDGRVLTFRSWILVPEDETVFCLFEGKEVDIRTASDRAGVSFERVVESIWFTASGEV